VPFRRQIGVRRGGPVFLSTVSLRVSPSEKHLLGALRLDFDARSLGMAWLSRAPRAAAPSVRLDRERSQSRQHRSCWRARPG